ncbi:hypothetical protein GCM10009555_017580 [Acrocarpospora macrocephala]|uniref:ADP ribosyltransferase domain-containing protein n=1 Tax=Acrocarpospora macrocephala TaxID=150177 RepID=A0A5M3WM70_9ACTN|nr:phage minor capsid protein [Acrocarpospora macrocephala]GES07418.1 hypothetical protein Amac_010130 [Acrocarpospora macrocephala]
MPADPDLLDAIAGSLADLYRDVEASLIKVIAYRLGRDLPTERQAAKLGGVQQLSKAVQILIKRLAGQKGPAARVMVAEAYNAGWTSALADLHGNKALVAKAVEAIPNAAAIERVASSVSADLGRVEANILRSSVDAYRAVQAAGAARILAGTSTRRQASQAMWQRLTDQGIVGFTDSAGRKWKLSTYVEMVARTNAARAAIQAQVDRLTAIDQDLVIVSDHGGECALCRRFESAVLSLSGPTGDVQVEHAINDDEMITVHVEATLEEAQLRGLFHPMCRHSISSYLPGVTKTPKNTADPAGDKARQRQRAIERKIRQYKERELGALTPEAKAAAKVKVKQWQGIMRDHLRAHPKLKRQPHREAIGAGSIPRVASDAQVAPVADVIPQQVLDLDVDRARARREQLEAERVERRRLEEQARAQAAALAEEQRRAEEADEAERQRLLVEAEKARREAEAAARALAEREEAERKAEEERLRLEAEAERVRLEAEERERQRRLEEEAEQARREAEAKAERERLEAEARAERERLEAERRAEEERARLEAEAAARATVPNGDFSNLRQIGPQGGSNPGGLFEDADGNRWYVKTQKSEQHAANEIAAARLYTAAGILAPEIHAGRGAPGLPDGPQTASRVIEGREASPGELRMPARAGFAADAWLANWDAAGLDFDNMLLTPGGDVARIDTGGALLYRAQGSPKGSAFGDTVTEWDTLRDPGTAPQAAKLFEGMTSAELQDSLERVERVSPEEIRRIVAESGLPDDVADRLLARRRDLMGRLEGLREAARLAETTLARLLDHKDDLNAEQLRDDLLNKRGTEAEREAWARALTTFDKLADKGGAQAGHKKWLDTLTTSDDPEAVAMRRLGQVKSSELRAAALRALAEELRARAARSGSPGMRHGLRFHDNHEGLTWAQENHPLPDLTPDEIDAVKKYTGQNYEVLNKGLRGHPPTDSMRRAWYDNIIANMDAAFSKAELPESVIVHRAVTDAYAEFLGADVDKPETMKALVGRDFPEHGFMSTSIGKNSDFSGHVLMIRLPKGHKALNVMSISDYGTDEREILLGRGTRYVVHGVYQGTREGYKVWGMELEVVPDDWVKPADWAPDPYGDIFDGYT